MVQLISLGILAGGVFLLQQFWTLIERPVVDFIVLGIIPGTNTALGLSDILLGTLAFFMILTAFEFVSLRQLINYTLRIAVPHRNTSAITHQTT